MEIQDTAAARTASQELERTRRALLRHMLQDRNAAARRAPHPDPNGQGAMPHPPLPEADEFGSDGSEPDGHPARGPWQGLRQAAGAWWQSHPAHLALELAEPLFEKYARAHPLRVLAVSAATGAAVVLARPWRLISVTGLLVAALRSTQMPALASVLLRPGAADDGPPEPPEVQADSQGLERWQQAQAAARTHTPTR